VYCNRTLNLRSIKAIGYDMDYTLVHYHVEAWERRSYDHLQAKLAELGWPVRDLTFDPAFGMRGLILDLARGNLVKADRFGYVKHAYHGTGELSFEDQRQQYARVVVDLAEPRWVFQNTHFSLSEARMYAQLVDLLDARALPGTMGYAELYRILKSNLDEAHMEGELKAEVAADPDRFVRRDPETAAALLDQHHAGKKLMLVTNSEWAYTRDMMAYAFDPYLPTGWSWQKLFDLVIVAAQKPSFFTGRAPLFKVESEDGLVRPCVGGIREPGAYLGGNAQQVEDWLGCAGAEILYIGDHVYGDVHLSKSIRRWRTGLILSEMETEVAAVASYAGQQAELSRLMDEKEALEVKAAWARLRLQRLEAGYGSPDAVTASELHAALHRLRRAQEELDDRIGPLARSAAELLNPRWGLLMRTGNDKSHLARQVERHADIYTSRVSNFLFATPFAYFRARRGSLPHDPA
jgi:HAD superfamily 5'-nucleotidase-like hydrolase